MFTEILWLKFLHDKNTYPIQLANPATAKQLSLISLWHIFQKVLFDPIWPIDIWGNLNSVNNKVFTIFKCLLKFFNIKLCLLNTFGLFWYIYFQSYSQLCNSRFLFGSPSMFKQSNKIKLTYSWERCGFSCMAWCPNIFRFWQFPRKRFHTNHTICQKSNFLLVCLQSTQDKSFFFWNFLKLSMTCLYSWGN